MFHGVLSTEETFLDHISTESWRYRQHATTVTSNPQGKRRVLLRM